MARSYSVVLCAAAALYAISCAPSALWQDSGLIQYRIWHNDIEGFLGLAISHPLFYILAIGAKFVPLGEFGYRVNLVSAMAGAVAVANLFLFVRLWLRRDLPAIVAAVTFAVSHTFWRHASIVETYTLWTALFLAELIVLLQHTRTKQVRYLYWLGLLNGLAISDHMLASIPLLCYTIFVVTALIKKDIRAKDVAVIALLWGVGALPYEYLIFKNIAQTGDVAGTLASAVFGLNWRADVINTSLPTRIIKENVLFFALNFPTPSILLFFVGSVRLFNAAPRLPLRNVLSGLTVLFFIFAFRYTVVDRYAFFIPFYCMVSIFTGFGAYLMQRQIRRRSLIYAVVICTALPIGVYAAAPALSKKMNIGLGTRGDVPFRDDRKYFLQPWKTTYRGAERFAYEALRSVGDNAVICADTTTVAPLLYVQQVRGERPDVKIVSGIVTSEGAPPFNQDSIEQLVEAGPVYTVSPRAGYCPQFVLDHYDLVPTGILWRVDDRGGNR